MKKSRAINFGLLTILMMTGCGQDPEESTDQPQLVTQQDCKDSESQDQSYQCSIRFSEAYAEHRETAPRYNTQDYCQSLTGGQCETVFSNGAIYWIPPMLGFAMAANNRPMPLYRGAAKCDSTDLNCTRGTGSSIYYRGGYVGTYSGSSYSSRSISVSPSAPSSFRSSVAVSSVSRGGFGGTAASHGGGGE